MSIPQHIVLIHGLWYGHWFTMPMAKMLRSRGYRVSFFRYPTIARSIEQNASALREFLQSIDPLVDHVVAHSLGGLVTIKALDMNANANGPDLIGGRVVLLGSPLKGSEAARNVRKWPGGSAMLGAAAEPLINGIEPPENLSCLPSIGMVAGDFRMGLGMLAGAATVPGDGTVELEETRMPGLADHVTVHTTHTGLLLSSAVADQVQEFLTAGRFQSS